MLLPYKQDFRRKESEHQKLSETILLKNVLGSSVNRQGMPYSLTIFRFSHSEDSYKWKNAVVDYSPLGHRGSLTKSVAGFSKCRFMDASALELT